jgi:ribosome-binding protein aMBF1 (putative translation factor)
MADPKLCNYCPHEEGDHTFVCSYPVQWTCAKCDCDEFEEREPGSPLIMIKPKPMSEALKAFVRPIAARIRKLREAQNLEVYELAALSGLPSDYIERLEAVESSPSHKAVEMLAFGLGVHIREISPEHDV